MSTGRFGKGVADLNQETLGIWRKPTFSLAWEHLREDRSSDFVLAGCEYSRDIVERGTI